MKRRDVVAGTVVGGAVLAAGAEVFAQADPSDVQTRMFTTKDFRLENGAVVPEATIAYHAYGKLAPDGRNAVLLTHGYTSSHHMAGRAAGAEGSWSGLVGPGRAIDTDRLFVVSSNMLGSSYGSTGPAHVNPATGKPWGPDFPDISVVDIVTAQKALLDSLGVKHLVAVAGPSYGGVQAFQWGVTFPDFMDGIAPVVSAPKSLANPSSVQILIDRLARDPNWNGGRYYDKGGIAATMTDIRVATLKLYGIDDQLKDKFPDKDARETEIRRRAEVWSKVFDGNSLVVLRKASVRFDAEKDFGRLRAKTLYVLSRTDKVFPPTLAPGVMAKLKAVGVSAEYVEIDSELGHSASGLDAAKWAPKLAAFMAGLERRA